MAGWGDLHWITAGTHKVAGMLDRTTKWHNFQQDVNHLDQGVCHSTVVTVTSETIRGPWES